MINIKIFEKLVSNNIHHINKIMKTYINYIFEKYKEEFIIKEEHCLKNYVKELLVKINLFDNLKEIIKDVIKSQLYNKIEEFTNVYHNSIIHDIITLFNDIFLKWTLINIREESQSFKIEFLDFIKKTFINLKTDKFFEIITNFPESHPSLIDIKFCLNSIPESEFITKVKNQISKRLLTPGVATPLIIEIFIRIIKMMKMIDPSSYKLELISGPIKKYLSQRKDSMRWIITTILSEEDISIKQDLGKQYVKSTYTSIFNKDKETDYECISSDEDEISAENWSPMPISNESIINTTKSKFSDIVSTLVNIFGSPEKFVEQYKRMLAERSVSENNFSLENELKNLELLKIKFGENIFQGCDIIIKDVRDSIKINNSIKNSNLYRKMNFELNCLIINKMFWPFKESNLYTLEVENLVSNFNRIDNFLCSVSDTFGNYKKMFTGIKNSRTLHFHTNIGYVDLTLTFDNGSFNFRVSPLSALIIKFYNSDDDEDNFNYKNLTVEFISEKLNCNINDVKKKINFWINKGVLTEIINEQDLETAYFIPNKNLKTFELVNEIIIEEDIYFFEYVENENIVNLENAISSILKNSGLRNFEQLFKNLFSSYQVSISEIKLNEILGKMILEQKIVKEGEMFKLIVPNY